MSAQISASQPFVPVITGGDLGAYSLAREFHEAYGVNSVVVPTAENLVVGGSKLTQLSPAGQMFDPEHVIGHLAAVARQHGQDAQRPLLLMPGYDHLVRIVVDYGRELRELGYVFPELSAAQLDQAALKENFYALCAEHGIKYPRTATFDCSEGVEQVDEFVSSLTEPEWVYPLVLKAGDGSAWANTRFPGRRKVHYLTDARQLHEVLISAIEARYRSTMIVQQFIPGPDSNLRILTHFRDGAGTNVLTGLAQVVVEDHAPGLEGNARALIAASDSSVEAQGSRLMDALNWHGFGMFDIKIHQESGEPYFLEMNPRLGRHHYYLTVAGTNPAEYLYRELVDEAPHPAPVVTDAPAVSTTIPLKLAHQYASAEQQDMLHEAKLARRIGWPLQYPKDRNFKRDLYQRYRLTKAAAEVHHIPGTMND